MFPKSRSCSRSPVVCRLPVFSHAAPCLILCRLLVSSNLAPCLLILGLPASSNLVTCLLILRLLVSSNSAPRLLILGLPAFSDSGLASVPPSFLAAMLPRGLVSVLVALLLLWPWLTLYNIHVPHLNVQSCTQKSKAIYDQNKAYKR